MSPRRIVIETVGAGGVEIGESGFFAGRFGVRAFQFVASQCS